MITTMYIIITKETNHSMGHDKATTTIILAF